MLASCKKDSSKYIDNEDIAGLSNVQMAFKNAVAMLDGMSTRSEISLEAKNEMLKMELQPVCYEFLESNDIRVDELWNEGTVWKDENGNQVAEEDVVIELAALLSCAIEEYQLQNGLLLDNVVPMSRASVTNCLATTFGIDTALYSAFKKGMTKMAVKRLAVTLAKQLVRHWMPAVGVVVSVGIFTACMYGY